LVLVTPPANVLYQGFIFSFIFCVFNALQGLVVLIWVLRIKKLEFKDFEIINQELDFNSFGNVTKK
jgi:hypothetical protein